MSLDLRPCWSRFVTFFLAIVGAASGFAVTVQDLPPTTVVTGDRYRLTLLRETADLTFEVRGTDGQWRVVALPAAVTYAWFRNGQVLAANGGRATWASSTTSNLVIVGQQTVLDRSSATLLEVHYLCRDAGVLIGARLVPATNDYSNSILWAPPRLALEASDWDSYLFWGPDGAAHTNRLATLQPFPAYAGVSPWGPQGDVVQSLSPARAALIVQSTARGVGLGTVFLDYTNPWAGAASFIQRYSTNSLYCYPGYAPATQARQVLWAWLAPFATAGPTNVAAAVDGLLRDGASLVAAFQPIAPPVPQTWLGLPPVFPADLRRSSPVTNLNDAAVFTVNDTTSSEYGVDLASRAGSDVLIRGWFKWDQAPPVASWSPFVQEIHAQGALFGGGITCSALYDGENGITQAQLLDMATRGPDGQLVNAWGQAGLRHGSLSSPAYLDYLFRWCREQIDAGSDYLFMDENTAALANNEGYDDHSVADFRTYLLGYFLQTQGWVTNDVRWQTDYAVDLTNPQLCPSGGMDSFDYRAYLRLKGLVTTPDALINPFAGPWQQFRPWRDDRAWKSITDRIRAYASQTNRQVFLSANGLVRYVDLQVMGVWNQWLLKDGQIDLTTDQLPVWRGLVTQGRELAGKRMPVVLFQDWGFGNPPYPWVAVPPSQREIWLRTRAAEIYAAGAFFAFPVLAMGCDAEQDYTLATMAQQTAFYQRYRDLYLHGRYLGTRSLQTDAPLLSLAAWTTDTPHAIVLHVINRSETNGTLEHRQQITVEAPLDRVPDQAWVVSPDWEGDRPVTCVMQGSLLRVTLTNLDAYAVIWLQYSNGVSTSRLKDAQRVLPLAAWSRAVRNEFMVRTDGSIEHAADLNGFLQGQLHPDLRNPPTFLVNAPQPATLAVHVSAVSSAGARLVYQVDGQVMRSVELPDKDGLNDSNATEYDLVVNLGIPAGAHRLTVDNSGADWLVMTWLEFQGNFNLVAQAALEGDHLLVHCNGAIEDTSLTLESCDSLSSSPWTPWTAFDPSPQPADGDFSLRIPAGSLPRYFRVVMSPAP